MSDYESKLVRFVKNIHKNTVEGKIQWTESIYREQFEATIGTNIIRIKFVHGEPVLSLLNQAEVQLESIESSDITNIEANANLHELYSLARRRAMNLDNLLDELNSKLD